MVEYVARGALAGRLGWTLEEVDMQLEPLMKYGARLAEQLEFDLDAPLSAAQMGRIFHYYLPVFMWAVQQLMVHTAAHAQGGGQPPTPPLILGISAPQGCGKTTLVEQLEGLFAFAGLRAVSVSIDDFYLTNAEQRRLAEEGAPGNPLLELRGNAGSHDMALWEDTLRALTGCSAQGSQARIPKYDKSLQSGRGDRAPEAEWRDVKGPVDVVLLEGWMLGFEPVGAERAAEVHPGLPAVDARLGEYCEIWERFVGSWVVVKVGDPAWVQEWRLQAEHQMRAAGKPGMSDEEVADFVARYMPAYEAYLPGLYDSSGERAAGGVEPHRALEVELDQTRSPRFPEV